jgi:hypothetical protein
VSDTSTLEIPVASDPEPPAVVDAAEQALFEEARRRRRRRWGYGTVAFVVLAAIGAGVGVGVGGGPPASLPTSAHAFATVVGAQTRAAGAASLSFTSRDMTSGGCIPNTNVPVTSGRGTIDFAERSTSVSMATRGCSNLMPPSRSMREIDVAGQIFYSHTQPPGRGRQPNGGMRWLRESGRPGASLTEALVSPQMLVVLNAMDGQVKRVGPSVVNGVPATKYEGHTTLARFYQSASQFSRPFRPEPGGSLIPHASTIRIGVAMWVNSADQLLRIRAVEPLYTAFYANGGGSVQGASQADSITAGSRVRALLQRNSLTVTVDLAEFGRPATIQAPSPSAVVHTGH